MSAFTTAMDATQATVDARVLGEKVAPALKTTSSALLDLFAKLVRGLDDSALTALFSAALANAADDKGWKPMHLACYNGHLEVAQWLRAQGL